MTPTEAAEREQRVRDGDPSTEEPSGAGARTAALERGSGDGLTLGRLIRAVKGIPAFGKLLFRLLGDRRVSLLDRALFGATLVYLFVPVDLVPDWIAGLGQLDDLLLVLFTLDRLLYRTHPDILLEHWDGDPEILLTLQDLLDRSADRLPGWARKLLRAG